MLDVDMQGKISRGRRNRRRKDACKRDMTDARLEEHTTTNWAALANRIVCYNGDPDNGTSQRR